jgi:probable addiction module antidote protein
MINKTSHFDISDYLNDNKMITEYLNAILEEGDHALLMAAIGNIVKARRMTQIASSSGLGRESLYKALSPGTKPRFETVLKVLNALGIILNFTEPKTV